MLGAYRTFRIFIFKYDSAEKRKNSFSNAAEILENNPHFNSFIAKQDEFTTVDRNGLCVHALSQRNYILISVSESESAAENVFAKIIKKISN